MVFAMFPTWPPWRGLRCSYSRSWTWSPRSQNGRSPDPGIFPLIFSWCWYICIYIIYVALISYTYCRNKQCILHMYHIHIFKETYIDKIQLNDSGCFQWDNCTGTGSWGIHRLLPMIFEDVPRKPHFIPQHSWICWAQLGSRFLMVSASIHINPMKNPFSIPLPTPNFFPSFVRRPSGRAPWDPAGDPSDTGLPRCHRPPGWQPPNPACQGFGCGRWWKFCWFFLGGGHETWWTHHAFWCTKENACLKSVRSSCGMKKWSGLMGSKQEPMVWPSTIHPNHTPSESRPSAHQFSRDMDSKVPRPHSLFSEVSFPFPWQILAERCPTNAHSPMEWLDQIYSYPTLIDHHDITCPPPISIPIGNFPHHFTK